MIKLEFLGTGTSTGVPVIGCDCAVCRSDDPHDTRLRASVLFRVGGTTLLVDTSPDLRYQALRSGFRRVDGLLVTHMHADHTAGIDELRRFNAMQQAWIPTWAPENAVKDLRERFAYAFRDDFPAFGFKPDLDLHTVEGTEPFEVAGVTVQPVPVMHGTLPILGYRVGDIAYLTDVKTIPEESMPLLEGLDVLVLTALRQSQHPAHMTLEESLEMVERIGPKRAYLTHIGHDMGFHEEIEAGLPEHVHLAYDGLRVGKERIAVVSDVHGNMTAYETVLADIEARGIRRVFNLGDVAGKGPRGSAAVALTRERCEATVRGNWDAHVGREDLMELPSMRWWHDELTEEDRDWLRGLPYAIDIELGGRNVRFVHASAKGVNHRVHWKRIDEEFADMFANTEWTGDGPEPDVVVYGDIHWAYEKEVGDRLVINAGSVGNALDEPTAAYLILEGSIDGGQDGSFRHEIVRVPYDIEAEVAVAEASGMLEVEEYATELRTAVFRKFQGVKRGS